MKVLSINVGKPAPVEFEGRATKATMTGIFKSPVDGVVIAHKLNLEGDGQADLTVHGGIHKAVYGYPSEHYSFWKGRFPGRPLPWGAFGENLTTEELLETELSIGDVLRVGTTMLRVTQPRLPCFKLAGKFRDRTIAKPFLETRRTGFYFAVVEEGSMEAGDPMEWVRREPNHVTVDEAVQIYNGQNPSKDLLERASRLHDLPGHWEKILKIQLT